MIRSELAGSEASVAFVLHPGDPQSFYVAVHLPMHDNKRGPINFETWLVEAAEIEIVDRSTDAWSDQIDRWIAHSYAKRLLERPELKWLEDRGHLFTVHIEDAPKSARATQFRIKILERTAAIQFALKCNDEMMPV